MVSANPNSCRAHVLRGQYLRVNLMKLPRDARATRSEEALQEADQALRLEPNGAGPSRKQGPFPHGATF
ncbi:MAG: hypothetical protein ACLQNE_11710 [Thermoguttaceae bacterium]